MVPQDSQEGNEQRQVREELDRLQEISSSGAKGPDIKTLKMGFHEDEAE